ncbi:MAG TPA: FkbM family methyltransferase [Puia sp.]|nr:FkbM family methyltransferase [Puia sp.]
MPRENHFTVTSKKDLFRKRLSRLGNFRRIPFTTSLKILFFYLKKRIKASTSENENLLNYYFLTLINCDCYSNKIDDVYFYFRNNRNIQFVARKNGSSDLEVFNQVWGRKEYEKSCELLKNNNETQRQYNIIDAGGNAGYTALYFNDCFPGAKIVSIEPDEDNYEILQRNIRMNNIKNIIPLKFGLWDKTINLKVDRNYGDGREWGIRVLETNEDTGLQGISLPDLLKRYQIEQIDLLKIDIEGAETKVFNNKEHVREFLSITKILAIEIHDESISRNFVYGILKENNFLYFNFSDLTIAYKSR